MASSVRLRILRICLHDSHTNKEIADVLGLNPGTTLHHVRKLVDNGYLRAEPPRLGARRSTEYPYRATGKSWSHRGPKPTRSSTLILDTFLDEIEQLDADSLQSIRLGLKLGPAGREEFRSRLHELLDEFASRAPEPDGEAWSIYIGMHPDESNHPGV
ncbi:winged helix-turn-helix domain-containing protein [Spelaeicoccus albus]